MEVPDAHLILEIVTGRKSREGTTYISRRTRRPSNANRRPKSP